MPAELIKVAPPVVHEEIASILNTAAETGKCPIEIKKGHLLPLPKPKKPQGPCKSLRPIILLSVLRKILAVAVVQRVFDRVREAISVSQAAYSPGRGASELILTFKLLAERAITSQDYEFHIIMLDMSRAFDTIDRASVLNNLKEVLEPDEIHLISLLIKDVVLSVKCDNYIGRDFTTNIGSPQGDCASPLIFIFELSKALEKSKEIIKSYSNPNIIKAINSDHTYCKRLEPVSEEKHTFSIGQEYADDCSAGSTNTDLIDELEQKVPLHLKEHGLTENEEKREKFSISHDSDDTWKNTILLGSKLDTESDINRRKGLASAAWNKNSTLLKNKTLPLLLRVRYFEAFISSIFLYQCGTWTLTDKLNHKIDVFQRLFLKRIVGIRYNNKSNKSISNKELYKITNQKQWSVTCKFRKLTLFGHTCRLPKGAPSRDALDESLRPVKKLVGGQKTTLISTIIRDFKTIDKTIGEAILTAPDRKEYRKLVDSVMSVSQETLAASRQDA